MESGMENMSRSQDQWLLRVRRATSRPQGGSTRPRVKPLPKRNKEKESEERATKEKKKSTVLSTEPATSNFLKLA